MSFLTHTSLTLLLLSFSSLLVSSLSLPSSANDQVDSIPPAVVLDHATVFGQADETTGTIQFLGIPFAQPPYVNPCTIMDHLTLT